VSSPSSASPRSTHTSTNSEEGDTDAHGPALTDTVGSGRPKFLVWLRELRAPFFGGTLGPIAFGAAYARFQGVPFDARLFAVTLGGALLTHAGLNMANDYFDHKSGDDDLTRATLVSGGSKVIQEGLLPPGQVLAASVACLVLAAGVGLYLMTQLAPFAPRLALLAVGIVGMVFAWFYTAPPIKLGHRRGMGELACTIGFGPVMAFGAYLVQARQVSWSALAAGLPIGLLMGLVLFINEFHDVEADAAVGKRTLVVAIGPTRSATLLAFTLLATYLVTGLFILLRVFPPAALITIVTAPLAWFAAKRAREFHGSTPKLLPANFAVIGLHLAYSTLLTVAVLI
jgi:1,4-dihydroxy-2-naphthoate octaprenyltransferase